MNEQKKELNVQEKKEINTKQGMGRCAGWVFGRGGKTGFFGLYAKTILKFIGIKGVYSKWVGFRARQIPFFERVKIERAPRKSGTTPSLTFV